MPQELAPRDKVKLQMTVVDEDASAEPSAGEGGGEGTSESNTSTGVTDGRSTNTIQAPPPTETFAETLYKGRAPTIADGEVHERDAIEDEAVTAQTQYNKNVNATLKDKSIAYDEDLLRTDPLFQQSASKLQELFGDTLPPMTEGLFTGDTVSGGTNEERLSEYGLDMYAEMVYNMGGLSMTQQRAGGTVPMLAKVLESDDVDTMLAALYVMEMGDRKGATLSGAGKALEAVVGDLSNYVGLAAIPVLTVKTLGKQMTSVAARDALRKAIQKKVASRGVKATTVTAAKVGGVSGVEGSMLSGAENMMRQFLEEGAGLRDGFDISDFLTAAGAGFVIGGTVGAGIVKIPDAVRALVDGAETGAEKAKELYKWVYDEVKNLEDDITRTAGGGKPKPEEMPTSPMDDAIASGDRKRVQAEMRNTDAEGRAKGIEFMKGQTKKATSPKAKEQIVVQETFNNQIYSRLEQAGTKIGKEDEFKGPEGVRKALLKLGVKPREIEASGVLTGFKNSDTVMGWMVHNNINQRPDKITKRTFDSSYEGFGGKRTREDFDASISDYVVNDSHSADGSVIKVVDDETGAHTYILSERLEDAYVDASGHEYDYEQMQDDWYDNYRSGDEWVDEGKTQAESDGHDDWDELTPDEQKDYIIAGASDEAPWYENYGNAMAYEVDGSRYEDLNDAKEAAVDSLWDDVLENGEDRPESMFFENYYAADGSNKRMDTYFMDEITEDSIPEGKVLHEEPHLRDMALVYHNEQIGIDDHISVQAHARVQDIDDGVVVDELQSQWEQDWRKSGGDSVAPTPERMAELNAEYRAASDKHSELKAVFDDAIAARDKLTHDMAERNRQLKKQALADGGYDELGAKLDELIAKLAAGDTSASARMDEISAERSAMSKASRLLYAEDPEYNALNEQYQVAKAESAQARKAVTDYEERVIAPLKREAEAKPSDTVEPPMKHRREYERLVLADQLLKSIQDGKKFFGWNNSGLQNGGRTPDDIREGMRNAYDIEMPRIIEKLTGKKPYKQYYRNHDELSKKLTDAEKVWDGELSKTIAYDEQEPWYWRVDLDDEVVSKLKDAKIDLYSVGGIGVMSAEGINLLDEEETE